MNYRKEVFKERMNWDFQMKSSFGEPKGHRLNNNLKSLQPSFNRSLGWALYLYLSNAQFSDTSRGLLYILRHVSVSNILCSLAVRRPNINYWAWPRGRQSVLSLVSCPAILASHWLRAAGGHATFFSLLLSLWQWSSVALESSAWYPPDLTSQKASDGRSA